MNGGKKVRFKTIIILIMSVLLLAACSGESIEETIYDHLEEAVRLESDFVEQQDPLSELEQEEQALYKEISDLSIEEFDQIVELSEKAIESIEQRREHVGVEIASIEASKKEFDKIIPHVEELEDEDLKSIANDMIDAMNARNDAFVTLHSTYQESLDFDVELYELLMLENLEEPEFTAQIEKVNAKYKEVLEANTAFNEATETFNEQKKLFYKASDLNVTYE